MELIHGSFIMSEEIDITKLHGKVKELALWADRDDSDSNGFNKLNTRYELALFKEMVSKAGLQQELKKQIPYIKGISVPIKKDNDNDKTKIDKKIISLLKNNHDISTSEELKKAVNERDNG